MFDFLLTGVVIPTVGPTVQITDRITGRDEVAVQVAITGTATVRVFGRLSQAMPWVQLLETSVSGIFPVARVAQMYAQAVAVTGAVSVASLA
jgi:hypothetical protein